MSEHFPTFIKISKGSRSLFTWFLHAGEGPGALSYFAIALRSTLWTTVLWVPGLVSLFGFLGNTGSEALLFLPVIFFPLGFLIAYIASENSTGMRDALLRSLSSVAIFVVINVLLFFSLVILPSAYAFVMILHVLSYMPPDNQEAYIGLVWFGSLLVALGFLFFAGLGGAARLMYDRRRANRK